MASTMSIVLRKPSHSPIHVPAKGEVDAPEDNGETSAGSGTPSMTISSFADPGAEKSRLLMANKEARKVIIADFERSIQDSD